MTLSESLLWSFTRSTLVASVALGPLVILLRQIASQRTVGAHRLWLMLSIFPFFVPELLIGFNYRLTAAHLSSSGSSLEAAAATELLYAMLQLVRCIAVGVAVSLLLPPSPITAESEHSWDLLRPCMRDIYWRKGWLAMRCFGPWSSLIVSWSLMSLITFQEFETAALMQIDRHPVVWSVWLFDAHAARQPLSDSLGMTVGPIICELLLLTPAGALLVLSRHSFRNPVVMTEATSLEWSPLAGRIRILPLLCILPGLGLFLMWPLLTNARAVFAGLISFSPSEASFLQSAEQILTSVAFAAGAAIFAMPLVDFVLAAVASKEVHSISKNARNVQSRPVRQASGRLVALLTLIPGLMGSLVCSLLLLAFFQMPCVRLLYDSWVPMLLGQTLAILPKATLAAALLQKSFDGAVVHSARLLLSSSLRCVREAGSGIIWRFTTGRWLMAGFLVSHWCFWDVTVASLLRPIQLEPVVTRLYNEMHYGRTEALMGLAFLATITPGVACLIVTALSRLRAIRRQQSANEGQTAD